jgi:DNA helicase HerA-like ATPase
MVGQPNAIEQVVDTEANEAARPYSSIGPIERLASSYNVSNDRLLGFLLDMSYDELQIVTCDAWKQRCGGVPKNSLVIIKPSPAIEASYPNVRPRLILARITDAIPTPIKQEIQQTIFQIHRLQALIDPITNDALQWAALKGSILGTYYDDIIDITNESGNNSEAVKLSFGNDLDSFFSPHMYEVYVPVDEHLSTLINSFVADKTHVEIGYLRYTETKALSSMSNVNVHVSPEDFIGNRTALFGKTRMGKSNTIKVIADIILQSNNNVGQIIFDPSGEYSYFNEQDQTSIYLMHSNRCTRYSLNPRQIEQEQVNNVPMPNMLRTNFFQHVQLGHSIITSLFDITHSKRPGYLEPFFLWNSVDPDEINTQFPDRGERTRYCRSLNLYYALLNKSGFHAPNNFPIYLNLRWEIKRELAANETLHASADLETRREEEGLAERQTLDVATRIYEVLYRLYKDRREDNTLFPVSRRSGRPYFEEFEEMILRMIGDRSISGPRYFMPFTRYHDPSGVNIIRQIVDDVDNNRTVIIDLSSADQTIAQYYSEIICKAILNRQMDRFANNQLGDHSVLFYFEEAHNLFRQDDKDLNSVYNKLAKEGAKFAIGMVYATQSMTTLSPDLLKNTENYFIAHLNDDREIHELERRYEFRDIALDVQRSRTKGYVRMITLSQRFALPVQIRKFEPR